MPTRLATTIAVPFALAAAAIASGAAAQGAGPAAAPPPARDCDVVWILEESDLVSAADRAWLHRTCALGDGPAEALRRAIDQDPEGEAARRRQRILRRLAAWEFGAAVIGSVLPSALYEDPLPEPPPASSKEKGLAGFAVPPLPSSPKSKRSLLNVVEDYLAAEAEDSSLPVPLAASLASPADWQHFAKAYGSKLDQPKPPTVTALTLFGDAADQVFVLYGGRKAALQRVEKANEVRGKGVFVAVVPRGVPLSIAVVRAGESRSFGVTTFPDELDKALWLGIESTQCVDLSLALEPGAKVYLDGREQELAPDGARSAGGLLQERVYGAADWHEVAILGPRLAKGGRRPLLAHARFDLAATTTGRCHQLRWDLRQRDFSNAVALLGVNAASDCVAAGIDDARLQYFIVDYLAARGREVKDVETWDATVSGLAALRETLATLDGDAVGADRARLDTMRAIASGARELLRQGFGTILSSDLHCSRNGPNDRWQYSLVGRTVSIWKLVTADRDRVLGLDLDDVVLSKIELAGRRSQLRAAANKLLGQLFGEPYLRFDALPSRSPFLDDLVVPLELGAGAEAERNAQRQVAVMTRPLQAQDAARVCERVEQYGGLGDDDALERERTGPWRKRQSEALASSDGSDAAVFSLTPSEGGPHLIRAVLTQSDGRQTALLAEDYACVDVTKDAAVAWIDLGLSVPFNQIDARYDDYSSWSLLGSFGPARYPIEAWFGAMHIAQSGDAPPDWSDLEYRSDYRIDGRLPYDVESNLVLLGAAWRVLDMFVDPTLCNLFGGIGCGPVLRRIGLVLRLGAYFDVRITDFSDVPSELASARGSTLRVDIGWLAQAGFAFPLVDDVSVRFLVHVGVPHALDWLTADEERQRQVDYFGGRVIGGSIGVGL